MKNNLEHKKREVMIRTPDHRLRVFVSSTLKELSPEREAVHQAITRLHLAPVMFESGARPHPAQDLYQAYLSQSHIFIGIYWQSYGWIGPGMQTSGLEDEYNRSGSMPRLIYIKKPSPEQDPSLTFMLERIRDENASSYKYFSTPKELRELVENDLILLLTEYFETARAETRPPDDLSPSSMTNVPVPRNPLIGRERELETACDLLRRQDTGLVTLTGPAGTGKSRLGIQVALDLRDSFSDGVYMVGLESTRNPGLVIPVISRTLNISEAAGELSAMDQLIAYLSIKQVLLLLDNFEQVLPAAPQVAELLEACPKVKILVTSRAPLHIRPEKELPIPPLSLPPRNGAYDPLPLSQYAAVQLFIQRCQGVKADFQVTNENAPAVAEICYRLDGLPLAIELAAARIKLLPPQALLQHLGHRFEILRGGTQDLPERQQTLYNAIDWSYNLLDDREKRFFQRLSIFCCGWTLEAAAAVCRLDDQDQPHVLRSLELLVDNNLVKPIDEESSETRMKMLESIHEFAFEHLQQSGEIEEINNRFEGYYLELAQKAETELYQSGQQFWHRRIEVELDNFRTMMSTALDRGRNITALMVGTALWRYWWTHGLWKEGFQWLTAGMDGPEAIPVELKAKALTQSGWYHRNMGNFPQAIRVLKESLALWEKINHPAGRALALNNLAASVLRQGDINQALAMAEQAWEISHQLDDRFGMCISKEICGHAAAKMGNNSHAIECYQQALSLAEELNDDDQVAKLLTNIGDEYVTSGSDEMGEEFFSRAAIICKSHGNRIIGGYIAGNRSIIALNKGDYSKAFDLLVEATTVMKESGDIENSILCLEPFAYIARKSGDPVRAVRLFGASETQRILIGMTRSQPIQSDFDAHVSELHGELGEAAFDAAWKEGSAMSLERALLFAFQRGS